MRIAYPVKVIRRDGLFHSTCPSLPEVSASAVNRVRLRALTQAALVDALCDRVKERRDLPRPAEGPVRELLEPPVLLAAKFAFYQTLRDRNMTNVAVANRLGTVEGTVRRLLDPRHRSGIAQVEAALAKLGKRLLIDLRVS